MNRSSGSNPWDKSQPSAAQQSLGPSFGSNSLANRAATPVGRSTLDPYRVAGMMSRGTARPGQVAAAQFLQQTQGQEMQMQGHQLGMARDASKMQQDAMTGNATRDYIAEAQKKLKDQANPNAVNLGTPTVPGATPPVPGATPPVPGATPPVPGATPPAFPGAPPTLLGTVPGMPPPLPGMNPLEAAKKKVLTPPTF